MEFEVDRFARHTGSVGLGEVDVEGLVDAGFVGAGVVTEGLEVEAVVCHCSTETIYICAR